MKKEITFQQKLDLIKAVVLVANFWEVEPAELIAFTALTKPEKKEEWNEIAKEVQSFMDMDIEDRAKKLGIKIKFSNESTSQ
jgi:ribosomal protein L32E